MFYTPRVGIVKKLAKTKMSLIVLVNDIYYR